MSQFFESIRVVNGRVMNLKEHQIRINRCTADTSILIRPFIKTIKIPQKGVYKLRLQYNSEDKLITEYKLSPYVEKSINSLKKIRLDYIKYEHKSEDRKELDNAFILIEQCDDVLIIKNKKITDTWYCNIAFFNGKEWYTPESCLLKGTMRSKLLKKGVIKEVEIQEVDIKKYSKIRLFNAMIPWSNKKEIPTSNIY